MDTKKGTFPVTKNTRQGTVSLEIIIVPVTVNNGGKLKTRSYFKTILNTCRSRSWDRILNSIKKGSPDESSW